MAPGARPGARAAPPPRARRSSIRARRSTTARWTARAPWRRARSRRSPGRRRAVPACRRCTTARRPPPARGRARSSAASGPGGGRGGSRGSRPGAPHPRCRRRARHGGRRGPRAEEGGPQARLTQRVEDSRRAGRSGPSSNVRATPGRSDLANAVPAGEHPDARPLAEGDDRGDVLRGQGECGAAQEARRAGLTAEGLSTPATVLVHRHDPPAPPAPGGALRSIAQVHQPGAVPAAVDDGALRRMGALAHERRRAPSPRATLRARPALPTLLAHRHPPIVRRTRD